jgi:hypothetical protein
VVCRQPGQIGCSTLSWKYLTQNGLVGWVHLAHACNPSYSQRRDHGSRPAWAISLQDPILKILNTHTHTKGLVEWFKQVVECLPSKCEALSSNPKKKKRKWKELDLILENAS